MLLIKNIEVYEPDYIGVKDVLICGNRIEKISDDIEIASKYAKVIDGRDKILIPGLIDGHVHITGGGGEGGFTTRVPEVKVSELVHGGLTTVVGLLGTDGTTRSIENVVAKAKAINELGLTCYALTGSYEVPTVTLTGSIKKDIMFIKEIIGTKMAVSDHRSSSPSIHEISRIASDTKLAGMLGGKAGIVTFHMGDGKEGLGPLVKAINETEIPIFVFRPTHVNRNENLLKESFEFAKRGGYIDLTCGISKRLSPVNAVRESIKQGVPQDKITISSDGYGSWSNYDSEGNLLEIGVSSVRATFNTLKDFIEHGDFYISDALKYFTSNVADGLRIEKRKGRIKEGLDADLLILDGDFEIETFIAMGEVFLENKSMKKVFPFE